MKHPFKKADFKEFLCALSFIEDARRNWGDLAVLWLDLTDALSTVPHKLIMLVAYHIPQKVQLLLRSYFGQFRIY